MEEVAIRLEGKKRNWVIAAALLLFTNNMLINYGVVFALIAMLTKLDGMAFYTFGTVMNTLGTLLMCPVAGRLSDLYGRKWITMIGIGGMCVVLGIASLAESPILLLVLYLFNGFFMGMAIGSPQAIIGDVTTISERPKFFSYLTAFGALGTLGGPLLASLVIDTISPNAAYYVTWPLGIIVFIMLAVFYPNVRSVSSQNSAKTDFLSLLFMFIAVGCLATYINFGSSLIGWLSPAGLIMAAAGILFGTLFVVRTKRSENPIVDITLFKDKHYLVSWLTRFTFSAYLTPCSTYIILYGQRLVGVSSTVTSTFSMPQTIVMMLMAPLVGRMLAKSKKTYRWGWMLIGLIPCVEMLIWSRMTAVSPLLIVYITMAFGGFAYTLFQTLYAPYFMETVAPSRFGAGHGLSSFASTGGGIIWGAIYGAIFNSTTDVAVGLNKVFTAGSIIILFIFVLGLLFVGRKQPAETAHNSDK